MLVEQDGLLVRKGDLFRAWIQPADKKAGKFSSAEIPYFMIYGTHNDIRTYELASENR